MAAVDGNTADNRPNDPGIRRQFDDAYAATNVARAAREAGAIIAIAMIQDLIDANAEDSRLGEYARVQAAKMESLQCAYDAAHDAYDALWKKHT